MAIKEALQFEQSLYELINTSNLPIETAYYVFKSVYIEFQNTLQKCAENAGDIFTSENVSIPLDTSSLLPDIQSE